MSDLELLLSNGLIYPRLELPKSWTVKAMKIANGPADQRPANIRLSNAIDGLQDEYSFKEALKEFNIILEEPLDWWHDYIFQDRFYDKKLSRSDTFSISAAEVEEIGKLGVEVFYICSDCTPAGNRLCGVVSSNDVLWKNNLDGNGSRFIYKNEL